MLYKNVLTFKASSGEIFSSLFYVKKIGPDSKTIIDDIYVLDIGVFCGRRFVRFQLPISDQKIVPITGHGDVSYIE